MHVVGIVVRLLEVELWVMVRDLDEFPVEVFPAFFSDDPMTVFVSVGLCGSHRDTRSDCPVGIHVVPPCF